VGYEVVRLLDSAHLNYMCTLSFVAILCLITFSLFFCSLSSDDASEYREIIREAFRRRQHEELGCRSVSRIEYAFLSKMMQKLWPSVAAETMCSFGLLINDPSKLKECLNLDAS
jgi:hypothetical protein